MIAYDLWVAEYREASLEIGASFGSRHHSVSKPVQCLSAFIIKVGRH